MTQESLKLEPSWKARVGDYLARPDMQALSEFLRAELRNGKTIYPPPKKIFAALDTTPFDDVKVVIIGQDPYHGPNQAHGLCFLVMPGVQIPPSLENMLKEIEQFFINYNKEKGKKFKVLRMRGPGKALKMVKKSLL